MKSNFQIQNFILAYCIKKFEVRKSFNKVLKLAHYKANHKNEIYGS